MRERGETFITEGAWVPLGKVLGVVAAILTGFVWLQAQFDTTRLAARNDAEQTRAALERLDNRLRVLESRARITWTIADQRLWSLDLARRNQRLTVPEPQAAERVQERARE